jgi:hypothetical protein
MANSPSKLNVTSSTSSNPNDRDALTLGGFAEKPKTRSSWPVVEDVGSASAADADMLAGADDSFADSFG